MPIVALKCPKCGGNLEMDDKKKSGRCPYCGTQVIIENPAPAKTRKSKDEKIEDGIAICESYLSLNRPNFDKYPNKIIDVSSYFENDDPVHRRNNKYNNLSYP